MRKGFGEGLVEVAGRDERVVGLTADLRDSVGMGEFAEKFPSRYVDVGVAEQNLVTVASGLAAVGKRPFVASYAAFMPGRCWEQIRTTICYNNRAVKLVGTHAGLNVGADGATHQMTEDVALMRSLPNMTVLAPCDVNEARRATVAMAEYEKPVYMRLAREKTAVVTKKEDEFEIGKARMLREGERVTMVACGTMVVLALEVAERVGAEVINLHTIKPLDIETILGSLEKTKKLVTVEEHQLAGGMGSAVLEALVGRVEVPVAMVGVEDVFGESGTAGELWGKYGLTADNIEGKCRELIG